MEKRYPHIFSPLKVGNVTFKNRIFSAPASPHLLQAQEEYPTEATIAYYRNKAMGGTANITVAAHNMDRLAPEDPGHLNYNIFKTQYHRYWYRLTSAIHFYGAKASLEFLAFIYHGYDDKGSLVRYSPAGKTNRNGTYLPRITPEEMSRIADDYAGAAENAVKCGFDMILIHGGHGLFLSNFLSPLFNDRDDEYGGSLENRAKFPIMVLDRIRERVGCSILIEYRISGSELASEGGFAIDDCIKFIKMIEDKIDIAHISAGNMSIPGTETIMHPTGFLKPGCNAYLAAVVKASGVKIPVLTLGAFQDPELIEQTLAEGKADIVAMARGTIADPELVNKARDGQEDEIIPCIKCFYCLNYAKGPEFACSVNPTVGREFVLPNLIQPVGEKKKVIVIGGGPAGMEAAIEAKKRGHDVTIYEKNSRLGGKLIFSEKVEFKYDLKKFMNYQIHLVEKFGIKVKLNTEATPEMVEAEHADVVLAAVGANAIVPPIPGINGKNVMIAEDAYEKIDELGESAAVIGGGQVGCETALHLAMSGRKVFLVEMMSSLASDAMALPRRALIERMDKHVAYYTGACCTGINENGLSFTDKDGKECTIKADTVILAAGMRPRLDEAEKFRNAAHIFWSIGDCAAADNVRTATRSAFDAASQI